MAELYKGEIQGRPSTRSRHKTDCHWHCDCERWGENEMPETDLSESGVTATDYLKKNSRNGNGCESFQYDGAMI